MKKIQHFDVTKIDNPQFLKSLSIKELQVLASDIRKEIIRATAKNGGHLSSNLGVVELTIALHRSFDFSKDKLIFDVGHQCYTHKILTGRSLENLRRKDGVSGFQKRNESIYDCYEAGHSSTSISAANGFAIARDLNGENYEIIPVIGDSSIVNGLAFEGLNNLSHSKHKVIIVLNDNEMAISRPTGGLSKMFSNLSTSKNYNKMKSGYHRFMDHTKVTRKIYNCTVSIKDWFKKKLIQPNFFTDFGFAYIGPVDGHDFKALEKAIKRAKNSRKSVVIHACTLKGKGFDLAEKDKSGSWHGVAPFDPKNGKPLSTNEGMISWSKEFALLTEDILEKHKNAILISPATQKGSCLDKIFENNSRRVIDVGISEEHACTMASSLSLSGYHPIISIYSTFMQRAYDEITHDIARMNCNVTFIVDRAGLVGDDGETHQGIYDVAYLSTIPGTIVTMPSNASEASALYEESFNNHGPFFIRLPRGLKEIEKQNTITLPFGKWIKESEDSDHELAIIGVGPLFRELQKLLIENNISCTLYNAIYLNPIDKNAVKEVSTYKKVIVYDPYSTQGGLVNSVMAELLANKFKGSISAYFVPNEFVKQASQREQLEHYNLLPEQIISSLKR